MPGRSPRTQPMSARANRLSTIDETSASNPANTAPSRLTNLPLARRLHLGEPPRWNAEKAPPGYSAGEREGQHDEEDDTTLFDILKGDVKGRGGWKRVALIVGLVLVLAIGLGVGLGVGLTQNNDSDNSNKHGKGNNTASEKFPAGSWFFTTYLSTIKTDCTSEESTWTCFPGTTYAESTTASETVFNWIISPDSKSNGYTIESSHNPFALSVPKTPLELRSSGTPDEHYTFTLSKQSVQTYPNTPLPGAGSSTTTCFFNDTVLTASLYTRKKHTYPSTSAQKMMGKSGASSDASDGMFEPWPYAVLLQETAAGGSNVPDCYRTVNNEPTGQALDLQEESSSAECSCVYQNANF